METIIGSELIPRTREGLIKLFVCIASARTTFRFDPKRMILDVLPSKSNLFKVFMPNFDYSLGQSREDHGNLEITEHRFINFLKFTQLTQTEIDQVFDAFERTRMTEEHPDASPPSNWEYSVRELWYFLSCATEPKLELPLDAAEGVPIMTEEELDRLYQREVKQKEKLKKKLNLA